MSDNPAVELPIQRIVVRVRVGEHIMAASDDPLFLCLRGGSGREFRLVYKRGKAFQRGGDDRFVLGDPGDSETNVAHAELNDPTVPPLDAAGITGVFLRKGFEPIPNVRAVGEMDDRIEIVEAEVEIHVQGRPDPIRHRRRGPVWLGLVCGLRFELPRVEDGT